MAEPMHDCPGGCGGQVEWDRLACKVDWFRLPAGIRRAVNRTWRDRARRPRAFEAARKSAVDWYRANPLLGGGG